MTRGNESIFPKQPLFAYTASLRSLRRLQLNSITKRFKISSDGFESGRFKQSMGSCLLGLNPSDHTFRWRAIYMAINIGILTII